MESFRDLVFVSFFFFSVYFACHWKRTSSLSKKEEDCKVLWNSVERAIGVKPVKSPAADLSVS